MRTVCEEEDPRLGPAGGGDDAVDDDEPIVDDEQVEEGHHRAGEVVEVVGVVVGGVEARVQLLRSRFSRACTRQSNEGVWERRTSTGLPR